MMQAAERPWMIRPAMRNKNVPEGEIAMSSDPRILKPSPALVSRTRPMRSARLPAMTIKIPENSAVMLTAMLFKLSLMFRSARIAAAILRVVCAKSQNVTTARTTPVIRRLPPWYDPVAVEGLMMKLRLCVGRQRPISLRSSKRLIWPKCDGAVLLPQTE